MILRISQVLEEAKVKLEAAGKSDYLVDAEWLMCEVTGLTRTMLSLDGQGCLDNEAYHKFDLMLNKRLKGMPLQYILGKQSFYDYEFYVNDHVLIPRFETEELVERGVDWAKKKNAQTFIDMCTGSGCIGLTLLKECEEMTGTLVDLSSEALKVADKNRKALGLDHRAQIVQSDLFTHIEDREVDMILSNPPYIETEVIDGLSVEVKGAEPYMALDGGDDGLMFYRKITHEAKEYLKEGGLLIYEIGYNQMDAVKKIFEEEGYSNIEGFQDLSGKDRIVLATR